MHLLVILYIIEMHGTSVKIDFLIFMIKDMVVRVHSMRVCRGNSRGAAMFILSFGTRWRSVVSLRPRPLYLKEITLVSTE